MVAAAVATIAYLPARERLAESANRLVYGERHPPDEVLRTWGSRLSRVDPDGRAAAPAGRVAAQGARAPPRRGVDRQRRAPRAGGVGARPRGREASHRARGAAGHRARRGDRQRVAHGVAARGARGARPARSCASRLRATRASCSASSSSSGVPTTTCSTTRTTACSPSWPRQVGLALHNVELDSALQATLEDLKRANEELARVSCPHRGDRRRRASQDRAQPPRRRAAAPGRRSRSTSDWRRTSSPRIPETAAEMLEMLGDSVKETIQELRDLAHGIYPPLLMDSGPDRGAACGREPEPARRRRRDRRRRPVLERDRGGGLLLLPRGAPERGQARARGARDDPWSRSATASCSSRSADDGPGFDVAAATRWPRLRQHERPRGRDRRPGRVDLRAGRGRIGRRAHPGS